MTKHREILMHIGSEENVCGGYVAGSANVGYCTNDSNQSESYARGTLKDGRTHVEKMTKLLDELELSLETTET